MSSGKTLIPGIEFYDIEKVRFTKPFKKNSDDLITSSYIKYSEPVYKGENKIVIRLKDVYLLGQVVNEFTDKKTGEKSKICSVTLSLKNKSEDPVQQKVHEFFSKLEDKVEKEFQDNWKEWGANKKTNVGMFNTHLLDRKPPKAPRTEPYTPAISGIKVPFSRDGDFYDTDIKNVDNPTESDFDMSNINKYINGGTKCKYVVLSVERVWRTTTCGYDIRAKAVHFYSKKTNTISDGIESDNEEDDAEENDEENDDILDASILKEMSIKDSKTNGEKKTKKTSKKE